ncbi:M20/M25/M40 family metallo-hydrolase [Rhodohalobacter halophilus]|uniref:M20/M25/M40 family metallo-hydrolase n=1 Tax=Rhodohalobacter halophilus TaxID=1812810 RepID=UPI00083FB86D|nr:M20/M25/M40 family metallo-hydrolase [Rhodohalobacter halophilus]
MIRLFTTTIFLATILFSISTQAQTPDPNSPYLEGYLKWDAGNYIGAIEDFLEILNGPDADLYFDDIAKLTGEIYKVHEISEDGRNPVFSPDNTHFMWNDLTGNGPVMKIGKITESGVEHLHTVEGTDLQFSPDSRHAIFFGTEATQKLGRLQNELSEAFNARNRAEINRLRGEIQYEASLNTSLYRFDLQSGSTDKIDTGNLILRTPSFDEDGLLWFSGLNPDQADRSHIFTVNIEDGALTQITTERGFFDTPLPVAGSDRVVFNTYTSSPFPLPAKIERHSYDIKNGIILFSLEQGKLNTWVGQAPTLSASGNRLAFMVNDDGDTAIHSVDLNSRSLEAIEMVSSSEPIQNPALSPDGSKLAYMLREGISWNLHMVHTADGTHEQLSFDIQHELFPHFLNDEKVVGMMGESRHRRSHIYDVNTKDFYRLFHNNRIRTVSMENDWMPSPDGTKLLVVAQRGGDTIAPEQGVYLVRIGDKISKETLIERLQANLRSEQELLANAEKMFEPIQDSVKELTEEINLTRLYHYQKDLYDFGSKHISQPGNQKAIEYIYQTLKSFGYEPELQWFNPSGDIETANVVARLEGTEHPEVVYILSSHFDSVQHSPGADDNTSGTAVLLEAARVLANNPQPATIIFASLTAEESGLLGAREFVRLAEEEGLWAQGVVNNDMMGWTRHHRLDNTIRFSNHGIKNVQHSGAMLFTDLITYDSRYYRNTDAHVFFDAYGDVLGGIGSYPILGNPNYHQTTDRLETINHRLVQEVSRSTTATLMMLANAPSKVTGLDITRWQGNITDVSWNPLPESDIQDYIIRYTNLSGNQREIAIRHTYTETSLNNADLTKPIYVIGRNNRGIEGWDWTVWEE